jgi:hypothetical protein
MCFIIQDGVQIPTLYSDQASHHHHLFTKLLETTIRPMSIVGGIQSPKDLLNHALPIARQFSVDKRTPETCSHILSEMAFHMAILIWMLI